uniref:Uncharacterized protein n=1 Tax=Arundo donax TaxID=35708 RepID=A0A0A9BEI8_ARUDO
MSTESTSRTRVVRDRNTSMMDPDAEADESSKFFPSSSSSSSFRVTSSGSCLPLVDAMARRTRMASSTRRRTRYHRGDSETKGVTATTNARDGIEVTT